MKEEYDFSKGKRGQFYNADAQFNFPIYLEPDIAKNADMNKIVNFLLKKEKELIEYGIN
jgi:hypothetical protein